MKTSLGLVLVLVAGIGYAAEFAPVVETRMAMPPVKTINVRERITSETKARAAMGLHYVTVDMDGATWKEEKALMKELRALGYEVDFASDHHTYGWNNINGALTIRWVARKDESWFPLFGDR